MLFDVLQGYEELKKNHIKKSEYPKMDMSIENSRHFLL